MFRGGVPPYPRRVRPPTPVPGGAQPGSARAVLPLPRSGVRIVRATRLEHGGTREERLLDLVRNAGGDGHLTSTTTTHVIDWTGFEEAGIPVYHQLFDHPAYPQGPGPFTPNLAAADLLFHTGTMARELLDSCSRSELRPSPQPAP
ncbi:WbqC family protein [Arthrobacter sp. Hiyo1]|uniref:WbqC family protein n=1 Tax=Arthrobacter sp. Hiyo1 TaxID=1588020 RepID=UPI0015595516